MAARHLDQVTTPTAVGPLRGLPIVVKDNIDLMGLPTTSGCKALASALPRRDAGVVRSLKSAGAIILAKTNLSEFSFEIRSRSSIGGDVRNPFDRNVTAGGSSGGAAVAVAAGFAVAAVGTDTGGSIRTPASFNGLVGFRPTLNAINRSGVAPLAPSTDTVGTLTSSVFDASLLFDVLTDRPPGLSAQDGLRPLDLGLLRIGAIRQAFGVDAEIGDAVGSAMAALRQAAVTLIDPLALPEDVLPLSGDHVVDWEFGPAFDTYLRTNFVSGAPASLDAIIESGDYLLEYASTLRSRAAVRDLDNDVYRGILVAHARLRGALQDLFDEHRLDALLYPTSAVIPTTLDNPRGGWAPELAACSGRPAISLPVGRSKSGIPIGLELLGRVGGDGELLRLAEGIERIAGRRHRPDLTRLRR